MEYHPLEVKMEYHPLEVKMEYHPLEVKMEYHPLELKMDLYSDTNIQANILNEQFKSAFTTEDTTTMPNKGRSPHPTMPEIKINTNGVIQLLKSINPHKATGPDNAPAHFLNNLSKELSPFLSFFFQLSINNGNISVDWKQANVVPILKKEINTVL
jgi:hypothetical protein